MQDLVFKLFRNSVRRFSRCMQDGSTLLNLPGVDPVKTARYADIFLTTMCFHHLRKSTFYIIIHVDKINKPFFSITTNTEKPPVYLYLHFCLLLIPIKRSAPCALVHLHQLDKAISIAASDLGLHCLPRSQNGTLSLLWDNAPKLF